MIKIKDRNNNEKTITFFDSVTTLPIKRYQLLQKYSLIDLGVGSTLHDVNRHLAKMDQFISAKDYESVALERQNLHLNFSFMLSKQAIPLYSLTTMVKTIDGEPIYLETEGDVDQYYELFLNSDITYGVVKETVDTLKKSLVEN